MPFGSRPEAEASSVLELVRRLPRFAFATASDRRERLCQNTVCFVSCQSLFSPRCFGEIRLTGYSGNRCCANSQRTTNFRSSRYRLARISPWVLQWYVLCGIPYRGRGASCLTLPNEPASFLPYKAGSQATLEAPLLISNFLRVSLLSLICKPAS